MPNYSRPQSPLYHKEKDTYFYPLTTIDQIIMPDDTRLNASILTVNLADSIEGAPNSINADTLGGYSADEYMRKSQSDIRMNYSVVGGTTEPANPTENMIWVNTDVEISKYKLSKNKPQNPIEGFIWISLDNNSNTSFHTLSIGGIEFDEVYLLSVKQYINGTWVGMDAMVRQSGNWISINGVILYENGEEFVPVTGGWQARGLKVTESSNVASAPTLVKNAASMQASLAKNGSSGNGGVIEIINDVDLTEYKELVVTFAKIENVNPNLLGIIVYNRSISKTGSDYTAPWSNTKASLNVTANSTATIEYSVDIASINETACVGIALYNAAHTNTIRCEITRVELVR